jgi:signal transduction histidine kinase/phosphopantetheine adenylyltransferase
LPENEKARGARLTSPNENEGSWLYRALEGIAEQILLTASQWIQANTLFVASNDEESHTMIKVLNRNEQLVKEGTVLPYGQSFCSFIIQQAPYRFTVHEIGHNHAVIPRTAKVGKGEGCFLIGAPLTRKDGSIYGVIGAIDRNRDCLVAMDMVLLTSLVGSLSHVIELEHSLLELQQAMEEAWKAKDFFEQIVSNKTRFLDMLSHEIRTPLNGMLGMAALLQDTDLTEEQREYATIIQTSGESLLEVLNNVLDISKLEAGKMSLDIQPFDIHACVEDVLDLFASKVHNHEIKLLSNIDPEIPAMLVGDLTRIRQVLVNLVSNALKFTDAGDIIVAAELGSMRNSYGELELLISVADTGAGIPDGQMGLLFQSFSQIPSSNPSINKEGTGLGLMISKQLVELMRGRIWAESKVGQGSTFWFTVQVKDGNLAGNPDGQQALMNKKVLVVDGHSTTLKTLKQIMEKWGMSVQTTTSAKEALDWIEQNGSLDLVIIDQSKEGMLLIQEIRERCGLTELPILVLATFGKDFYLPIASGLYNAKVKKPVNTRRLLAEIIACLL